MTHPQHEVIDDRDGDDADQEVEDGMNDEAPSNHLAPDEASKEPPADEDSSENENAIAISRSRKRPSDPSDNGEASSTGGSTSEGKSESGGGYSGDCSASEQWSDDTGGQKNSPKRGSEEETGSAEDEDDSVDKLEADKSSPPTARPAMDDAGDAGMMVRLGRARKSTRKRDRVSASGPYTASLLPRRSSEQSASSSRRSSSKQGAGGHDDDDESDDEIAELKERIGQVALEMLDGSRIPPQWNGVRIKHPMDPRIDLSTVGWSAQAPLAHPPARQHGGDAAPSDRGQDSTAHDEAAATLESYQRIMEVVKPWFMSHGDPYVGEKPREDSAETQGSGSSEGFTSFFTTTHSGSSSGGGAGSNSSDQDKKPAAQPDCAPRCEQRPQHAQQQEESSQHEREGDDGGASDTSSMIVLARAKRKHSRRQEEGDSNASNSSRERRVRIQDALEQDQAREARQRHDPRHANDLVDAPENDNINNDVAREPQESSVSSSSSHQPDNAIREPGQLGGPPHFVTDVSSSNRTDSTGSNINSSSGSGSAGNTASGTGSGTGSGSNQGSSGSGNDNDGKGSSDEVAKEENSADGTNNEGSDEAEHPSKRIGLGLVGHRHDTADAKPDRNEADGGEGTARERKLIDKKRKRIEMRREYEAQQQSESSESNDKKGDSLHRPGKPVTMDEVLQFSKIPRVVVQALPPFAVVHTNAAYSRLTGVDSHKVIGKPIRALLSLPDGTNLPDSQDELSEAAETLNDQRVAALANRARSSKSSRKSSSFERLVVSSGYGHLHSIHVHTRPHHMLGKNVSFLQDVVPRVANASADHELGASRLADFGSPDASLTGSLGGHPVVRCIMSVAPVVSTITGLETMVVSDKESGTNQLKGKRRKVHANEGEGHRTRTHPIKDAAGHRTRHTVTHFVIQLQQELASAKQESEASLSSNSTSVEARLLGLSKAEFLGHRKALEGSKLSLPNPEILLADDDVADSQSHSTATKEVIATVG